MSEISVVTAVNEFILNCKVKNLTPTSIKSYQEKIGKFLNFVGNVPLESINKNTITKYIISMQEEGIKDVTINSYLRAVRAFLYYCMEEELLESFKIKLIRQEDPLPKAYSKEEIEKLLKTPTKSEYKTWVLINYLLATGNRISTALDVKIGDVDFVSGYINLHTTKNRKQQIIPMSNNLSIILLRYLRTRGGTSNDYLFCNESGGRACKRVVQEQIANYNKKRGVDKTSCHAFRHTFAMMYLSNGGNAFGLQKLLGHSDLTMTKKYIALCAEDLKENFDILCPI